MAGVFGVLGDVGEDVCHAGQAFACGFDVDFGGIVWFPPLTPLGSGFRRNDVVVVALGIPCAAASLGASPCASRRGGKGVVAIFHGLMLTRGSGELFLEF